MVSRLRIVVLGYIVRGPLGGLCWHHAQYALALQDAGHEVCFIEDSGETEYCCYDPIQGVTSADATYGLQFTDALFSRLNLDWAYFDRHRNAWFGPAASRASEFCRNADLVVNLSLANELGHNLVDAPVRVAVDTDPVFTQIRNLTDPTRRALTASHNRFFSYGANLPVADAPDDGFPWKPTRQPIVLRLWDCAPPRPQGAYTTVMQWDSYAEREWKGRSYGQKSRSFTPFIELPKRTTQALELAVGSATAPRDQLRECGWRLCNPNEAILSPSDFQSYIRRSKAEFSVAKHGYVVSRCGWFSDRTAAYLASGRPAVVQDTGFAEWLSASGGLLSFRTPEEAVEAIERISGDYEAHCGAARELAGSVFEAQVVLREMLPELC